MNRSWVWGGMAVVGLLATARGLGGQSPPAPYAIPRPPAVDAPRVGLYDTVARVLRSSWPDRALRTGHIERLLRAHQPAADSAQRFGDELAVVQRVLTQIPSSHLGITSVTASQSLARGVGGNAELMFGVQLVRWAGRWYASSVLDGGPAALAGVRPWDEVVAIDGVRPEESPRLDYPTNDAYLDDMRDPPVHPLLVDGRPSATFRLRQTPRDTIELVVQAAVYRAGDATQRSVRVMELEGGVRIGVVHFWFMHGWPGTSWFVDRFDLEWSDIDAFVFDARGRGGYGNVALELADVLSFGRLQRFRGPVVVLQDRQTRSAKEMLIEVLRQRNAARLVGEPTAGAVVGSISRPLGHGLVLTMPASGQQPSEWSRLELHPIEPDVPVLWGGPLAASDPIFEAGIAEVLRQIDVQGRGVVLPPPIAGGRVFENTLKSKIRPTPPPPRPD